MASVFLQCPYPPESIPGDFVLGSTRLLAFCATKSQKHVLSEKPDNADLIIFPDAGPGSYFSGIRRSNCFKRFWRKCFVISQEDNPVSLLPGVYASIERRWHDPAWTRSGFYLTHMEYIDRFQKFPFQGDERWLFSFTGSCSNAAVREAIRHLRHPQFLCADTSGEAVRAWSSGDELAKAALDERYQRTVRESRFVLCPRGKGCSSLRLFEVMEMGRCPVIIADDWVEPFGPAWSQCSLRIPEAAVSEIPAIMEKHQPEAGRLGARAREEWERWFSPHVLFDTVVDWCLQIQAAGLCESRVFRWQKYQQFLSPFHRTNVLRLQKQRLVSLAQARFNKSSLKS